MWFAAWIALAGCGGTAAAPVVYLDVSPGSDLLLATVADGAATERDAVAGDVVGGDVVGGDVVATDGAAGDAVARDAVVGDVVTVSDAAGDGGAVTVCGASVPRAGSWRAEGSRVYYGDDEVHVWGLNWFGLETPDRAPHGLWVRPLEEYVAQVASMGFTALRIPLSPQSIRPGFASASWAQRDGARTGREWLEALLTASAARGLRVVLTFHTCDSGRLGGSLPGSPLNCSGYTMTDWLSDLRELAALAERFPSTVMGIDLCNEPHALSWTAWRDLAAQGGQAVLCRNPRVLVFVEGVGNNSDRAGYDAFWGENLTEAGRLPVDLPRARLVYSPHVYGPSVSRMSYFGASDFPRNMPAIWESHFGHLATAGQNMVMGEFCGWYDDGRAAGDVAWQDAMVSWLDARGQRGFFYWALNPNAGDTGGVLHDDWRTPDERKLALLRRLMH